VSSNANVNPEDASALWILFRGREWIVLHNEHHYTAFPADNRRATKAQADKLFSYLKSEGFIDEKNQPNKNQ